MTTKLTALRLDQHTVIYIEATEDLDVPDVVTKKRTESEKLRDFSPEMKATRGTLVPVSFLLRIY